MKIAVIGAGVVGLATTSDLIQDGAHEVRCYESSTVMGTRSRGDTRIFRVSHRDSRMMELAARARSAWSHWTDQSGKNLVGHEGLLVNTPDREERMEVLRSLDVPAEIVSDTKLLAPLTSHQIGETLLHDPWAGVIRAPETGRFLADLCSKHIVNVPVEAIELTDQGGVIVRTLHDTWQCDSVVVVAGTDTPRLAATCGLELPIEHTRLARFTFRMNDQNAVPPCWFDTYAEWDMWGLTAKPGHWAMGINLPSELTRLSIDEEDVTASTLAALQEYMQLRMERLEPEPVDVLPCIADKGWDGMNALRKGAVLTFWGDNHFKFAPVLGSALADAAKNLELPNLPLTNIDA